MLQSAIEEMNDRNNTNGVEGSPFGIELYTVAGKFGPVREIETDHDGFVILEPNGDAPEFIRSSAIAAVRVVLIP